MCQATKPLVTGMNAATVGSGFFQVLAAQNTPNIHLGMPVSPLDIQFISGKGGSVQVLYLVL